MQKKDIYIGNEKASLGKEIEDNYALAVGRGFQV